MIEIEVDSELVLDALSQLAKNTDDLTPVFTEIGEHIASEIDLNFRDASDPYGNSWEKLKHRSGTPLNDTGRLKNSITFEADSSSVEVGTNVEYAGTHQFGAEKGQYGKNIPWGDIPARPFLPTDDLGLPALWEEEILDIIQEHLELA